MRNCRAILLFVSCMLLLPGALCSAQQLDKSPSAVREAQSALRELGYLRAAPNGTWDDVTRRSANLFLGDVGVHPFAGTSGEELFILRHALSSEIARRKKNAVEVFVPLEVERPSATHIHLCRRDRRAHRNASESAPLGCQKSSADRHAPPGLLPGRRGHVRRRDTCSLGVGTKWRPSLEHCGEQAGDGVCVAGGATGP